MAIVLARVKPGKVSHDPTAGLPPSRDAWRDCLSGVELFCERGPVELIVATFQLAVFDGGDMFNSNCRFFEVEDNRCGQNSSSVHEQHFINYYLLNCAFVAGILNTGRNSKRRSLYFIAQHEVATEKARIRNAAVPQYPIAVSHEICFSAQYSEASSRTFV